MLGKPGFQYLKRTLFRFFRKYGPPDRVSPVRYRIGLAMFLIPVLFGWLTPYLFHALPAYGAHRMLFGAIGDVLLVSSLFVLGGDFWDKVRALFVYGAKAQLPEKEFR